MYTASEHRYQHLNYRRAGLSGLILPPLTLGCCYSFSDEKEFNQQKEILYSAFDLGITHLDLTNNHGMPVGHAEKNIGSFLKHDLKQYRDELIISTKASSDMWPGPYGNGNASRKYLVSNLDQSLMRLGVDYVDVFYVHCFDRDTPLEETASALADIVKQGKALYVGVSVGYPPELIGKLVQALTTYKVPLTVYQSYYNILNPKMDIELLKLSLKHNFGIVAFTPFIRGLLGDYELQELLIETLMREGDDYLKKLNLPIDTYHKISQLEEIASQQDQNVLQFFLSWILRCRYVTSTVIEVSNSQQIIDHVKNIEKKYFTEEEIQQVTKILTRKV